VPQTKFDEKNRFLHSTSLSSIETIFFDRHIRSHFLTFFVHPP
jgi:hypothetical protein